MAPKVALEFERERRQHRRHAAARLAQENRCQSGLPAEQVQHIRAPLPRRLRHRLREKNEARRVVGVVLAVHPIQPRSVEILVPPHEKELHAARARRLPDIARQPRGADLHREFQLRPPRAEPRILPHAAVKRQRHRNRVPRRGAPFRQFPHRIREVPRPRERRHLARCNQNFHPRIMRTAAPRSRTKTRPAAPVHPARTPLKIRPFLQPIHLQTAYFWRDLCFAENHNM